MVLFFITLLNQFYWVASATIGGIIGSLLKFDTSGISFVMTAMFVVIFLDQWMKEKNPCFFYDWNPGFACMSDSLRSGFLYDSDNDTDCTSTDSTSKVAGTMRQT